MGALYQSWKDFEERVIHSDADDVQRDCMREAYYAGAFAMYVRIVRPGATIEYLRALQIELQQFADEVEKQKFATKERYDA